MPIDARNPGKRTGSPMAIVTWTKAERTGTMAITIQPETLASLPAMTSSHPTRSPRPEVEVEVLAVPPRHCHATGAVWFQIDVRATKAQEP